MGQLIDDLLAFSRTGKKELIKQDIDMTNLANAVVEEVRISTGIRKGTITVQELPPAYADHSLLTLVFTNLINNAIKYSSTKENPEITIGSMKKNDETVYFIKDNGVGFDMQYYNKLFGVFQRLHSAQEFEGTGVGLALIKRIILRHGGRIWAEGKKGEGATFYFTLN
jgi:light-regulated signal transduction histidine kinase (bacteriophytochrome)